MASSHTSYPPLLSDLSPTQRELVLLMQSMGYGSIENLHVSKGVPVFDPAPTLIRVVKLGTSSDRRQPHPEDYRLKVQVLDLLDQLIEIKDGVVQCIVVKGGLPFTIQYEHETK